MKPGDILDFGPPGKKTVMTIRKVGYETNGQSFELEMEIDPHSGGPPMHWHPLAIETYEVLQGHFDVYLNGAWKTLSTGETIVVAKGVPHTFRNASAETTRVYNTHQPALNYDGYFDSLFKLAKKGVNAAGPMSFQERLYLAVVMTRYADENRLVHPSYPVMQVLGFLGRALGYTV